MDHSNVIKGPFKTGPDVTKACLQCHLNQAHDFMKTVHWTWSPKQEVPGKGMVDLGKVNALNNYCIALPGSYPRCTSCHAGTPHKGNKVLDRHAQKIACQTCHIPTYARLLPTKVWWDWSSAGKDQPVAKDRYGEPLYDKQKGDFRWVKNEKPVYQWFNGSVSRYLIGDKIDPAQVIRLNYPRGDRNDPKAKIAPFKIIAGKQPYDSGNNIIAVPQLFGGYWNHWDWNKAIADGMKVAGLPYSGQFGWIETAMYWKVNHMVVPKSQALKCNECHTEKGRLDWKSLGYAGDPQRVKN